LAITELFNAIYLPLPDTDQARLNGGLVGRWAGEKEVSGDASGGTINICCYIGTAVGILSQFALFDVRYLLMHTSTVQIPDNTPVIRRINAGEYGGGYPTMPGPQYTDWQLLVRVTATLSHIYSQNMIEPPRQKFGVCKLQGQYSAVLQEIMNNTNGAAYWFHAGGYVYDERYLNAD